MSFLGDLTIDLLIHYRKALVICLLWQICPFSIASKHLQSFAFLQCFDMVRHQKGRPAYKNTKTILLAIRLVYHKHLLYSLFCFCVPTFPGHSSLCGPGGCQKITSVDRLTRFFYQMLVLSFSLKHQNILRGSMGTAGMEMA